MRFSVVAELTAVVSGGDVALVRPRPTPRTSWTEPRRALTAESVFEGGNVAMTSYRGYVSLRGEVGGYGTWTNGFRGAGRFLAAQREVRRWRAEAARWAEAERQLARRS